MTNLKARAAAERVGHVTSLFENPEVTAMAAICDILQELPDEASRLRVMHWSFGRFCPEFKRPLTTESTPVPPALAPAPVPVPVAAAAAPVSIASASTFINEIAAVAPHLTESHPAAEARDDFGSQISELRDMFGGDVRRPARPAFADAF